MFWNNRLFPGTNLQDLNLDWILKKITALRGGTTGQVLYKKTDKDFDFGWKTGGGGSGEGVPIGGLTGEYLRKHSNADYDTEWAEIDMPQKVSDLLNDAGYITGLTTLTYGESSYGDFINAFNANKIVFCKAFVGDDPGIPTNQTRLAYLNYISKPVNPTRIEFVYYRNIKTHSIDQQGDQCFVYSLDNNDVWSFEVRNTFTEIDVGTGLLKTYSNGKLTLSSTGGGGGGSGVTFIPSVSSAGVISWTNDGGLPNPEPVNIKGPAGNNGANGATFTPSVSSAGVISWTNDGGLPNPDSVNIKGPAGNDGADGSNGSNGTTFTPTVSSAGVISWTNDGGLPNPNPVNIKGPQGAAGATGATGATGPAGKGVPTGGTTGQVLVKNSNSNYDTKWAASSETDSGWITLQLDNYVQAWDNSTAFLPRYRKIGKIVTISGVLRANLVMDANQAYVIAYVPSGFRPASNIYGVFQGSGMNRWLGYIRPNGEISLERYGTTTSVQVPAGAWLPFQFVYTVG